MGKVAKAKRYQVQLQSEFCKASVRTVALGDASLPACRARAFMLKSRAACGCANQRFKCNAPAIHHPRSRNACCRSALQRVT